MSNINPNIEAHGGRAHLQNECNKAMANARVDAVAKLLAHVFGSANEVAMMTTITDKVNGGHMLHEYEEKEVKRILRKYKHKLFNKGIIAWFKNTFC